MNAAKASLINAATLLIMGVWGYVVTNSPTALIPVGFGVVLLALNNGVKKENKIIAHIAVVLTLLIIPGLIKPFSSAVSDGDSMGMLRVGLMILTSIYAMIYFVKSFIDARKNKAPE